MSYIPTTWISAQGGSGGPHTHPCSEVVNLQSLLDGKQEVGAYALTNHNHAGVYQPFGAYSLASHDHAGVYQPAGSYAAASHGHVISDVTGLQAALDGKQAAGSYAAASHNHDAAYSAIGHNHSGVYQPVGSYALTSHNHDAVYSAIGHTHSYEPVIAAGTADQYWRGDKTWQTLPAGGSDPWTYLKVTGQDFSTTLATWSIIPGLIITPPANSTIEIEGALLISTATAAVGPRPGVNWGSGLLGGGVTIHTPTSLTATAITHQTVLTTAGNALAPVGGLPVADRPYRAHIFATITTGAAPQAINVLLASETAGTAVKARLGSHVKWRAI
jgi:hypothetical protein